MALHDLNRAQDTAVATLKVADIVPRDWHRFPAPITAAATTPSYVPVYTWNGGVYGDDQILAKTNVLVDDRGIGDYEPRNQDDKAKLPGASPPNAIPSEPDFTIVTDITAPRGYIGPRDPYSKAVPAAPVVSSLAPNTAVAGSPSPLSVIVTGTGFTPFTILIVGNIQTPYVQYFSPTKLVLLMDPARSVAGVITVFAVDHSVQSAPVNFTYS
jgi:hypothetical protein